MGISGRWSLPNFDNSNMTPRPSGHIPLFGLIFFVLKSLLRISTQWNREKCAIFTINLGIARCYLLQVLNTKFVGGGGGGGGGRGKGGKDGKQFISW